MTVMSHHAFLLLMLCVGVTVSRMVDLQKRIYGGKDCGDKERLYHVSLSEKSDVKPGHCGGSLISEQWVLTAAHCKTDPLYAVVGVHPGKGKAVKIDKKDIIPHVKDDIMLLKLPESIKNIHPDIHPVDLPTCKDEKNNLNKKGDEVQLAGHGFYKTDPKTKKQVPSKVDHLQCGLMHVAECDNISVDDCYSKEPYKAPQGNRLCFEENYMHPAEGDSGGGVIYGTQIYAIHIAGTYMCPKVTKGVSLRVCSYIGWINENIKK